MITVNGKKVAGVGPAGPTVEQRVSELEEALDMILEGVTGDEV